MGGSVIEGETHLRALLSALQCPALHVRLEGYGLGPLRPLLAEHYPGLARLCGLEVVGSLSAGDEGTLNSCTTLTGLTVFKHRRFGSVELLEALLQSPWLARLRTLAMGWLYRDGRPAIHSLTTSPWLPRLRELEIDEPASFVAVATSAWLPLLARWPGLRRLDRLKLKGSNCQDGDLEELARSPHLHPATRLTLNLSAGADVRALFQHRLGRRFST